MKKINICFHIGNISNCGGTEKVTTQISNLLLEKYNYYNIFILSNYMDSSVGPFFKGDNQIEYHSIYNSKTKNLKLFYFHNVYKINSFIKQYNIDILIGVDTILALFDLPATIHTKCKYIAWEHFNYYANLGVKLRDIGRKYAAKKADALVVLTDKDKLNFENNLKIKTKLVRIYNPFFKKEIKNESTNKENQIVSCGRLTYQKGFDILLEVAKKLFEKNKNFKWVVLGDGEDYEKLEKQKRDFNLDGIVEFKGKVTNVDDYYKNSKLFVLTSRFEGLVLVMLEAKSFDLPVVSFNCNCGPDEVVDNGVNGYLISNFDTDDMAQKINNLLQDENQLKNFSSRAKLKMEVFSPKLIVEQWDQLFKELIGEEK